MQYVDNTAISAMYCARDSSEDLSTNLNEDLASVANWVEQNGLKLNETITQMLLLSRKRRAKELDDVVVKLKGQQVTWSEKVKYLGFRVDNGLNWKEHIEVISVLLVW